ncbi:MAG: Unknown protein [uncultured Sulfurovum sp.]|uniref:Uncharacterized protein n=1 Tax=uncultured Sulfurovum sp. TaxID=269237 RepID=A0A6S6TTC1_9BACT|nr:MAG: Unknown protein [uncultured Sulfurovum sp.]
MKKNQQSEDRTSLAISNQNENISKQTIDFVDNSPEAQEAKQLQNMADNSEESLDLQEWQSKVQQSEENTTGLPDALKANLESKYGMSLDHIKVHYNSSKPAKLEAHAYAKFPNIYIAPGQEKHLPEEAAHMVQQMQGRVKPTKEVNGTPVNDNDSLEKEAVQEGQKASGGVQKSKGKDLVQNKGQQGVVQRAKIEKESHYGTFSVDDAKYKFINNNEKLDANITFEPGDNTDATKIGLTQVIKHERIGELIGSDPNTVTKMTEEGYHIDRLSDRNNPIYGSNSLGIGEGLEDTKQDNNNKPAPTNLKPGTKRNASYELGHHYKEKKEDENFKSKNAGLYDSPTVHAARSMREFETTALALDGEQKGEYYGSVKWGWIRDRRNNLSKIDFELVSKGVPSKNFMKAAGKWNTGKTRGILVVQADSIEVKPIDGGGVFTLKKNDKVMQKTNGGIYANGSIKANVIASTDDNINRKGKIDAKYLKDEGGGEDTVDLPLVTTKVPTEGSISLYKDKGKANEEQKLDKKTRMKMLKEDGEMVEIEIVDGAEITKTGWVEKSKLKDE